MNAPKVKADTQAAAGPVELTLRDRFALQVVAGCLAAGRHFDKKEMAAEAYELADAMVQARKELK
jgi:hypothetical protein